jgi:F-type H+-transporting ATPase subunit gamma
MANARALDRRRQSVRNIRKITRTMELIANARFKRAMDRAVASTEFTQRITQLVADLAHSGLEVSHPLLEPRTDVNRVAVLVLTANRGMCGGYNASVLRQAVHRIEELRAEYSQVDVDVSGKRGISALRFRKIPTAETYTHFEDRATYEEVEVLANRYLDLYVTGKIDRLEVCYTKFINSARQEAVVETLLPLGGLDGSNADQSAGGSAEMYEFLPSAESILEEVVPTSFRVRLFKSFLDAAVSEQIARMVAMKSATENADDIIRQLSMTYNRARQTQITGEIMEIIGGVEALEG